MNQNEEVSSKKFSENELSTSKKEDFFNLILADYVAERRRARLWSVFKWFSFLLLISFIILTFVFKPGKNIQMGQILDKHTALISLTGLIQADGDIDAGKVNMILKSAYKEPNSKGIIIRLNSPGGSPVQSALIYDEIMRLKKLKPRKPIIAVVEDVAASGGYFIASAADEIYVNKSSMIGSIGVLMNGFGFTEMLNKIGVERRLMVAGSNKAMLDPFSNKNPEHQEIVQKMLNEVHQHFIDAVKLGRGEKLSKNPVIFSGSIFTGEKSVELGLSDDFGSVAYVAENVIYEPNIIDYGVSDSIFDKLSDSLILGLENFSKNFISYLADAHSIY